MRKKLSVLLALLGLALFAITPPALAQTTPPSSNQGLKHLRINYETMLGHKGRTRSELVQELLNHGLSVADANYYADMDILVKQVELQKINLNVDLNTALKLSDQFSRLHPDEVRTRALSLDPRALKTLLAQNDAMSFGAKDARQVSRTLGRDSRGYSITIEYPDGSKFIESSNTVKTQPKSSAVKPNTFVSGPWNQSTEFSTNTSISNPGNYTTRTTWQYQDGASVASVEDVYKWTLYTGNSWYTTYDSDLGAASYAGVVSIDIENDSNHQNSSATGSGSYIQGYTDCRFVVSGSFSANFQIMNINVNAGAGWHEYAVTEVDGVGDVYGWAAQYI